MCLLESFTTEAGEVQLRQEFNHYDASKSGYYIFAPYSEAQCSVSLVTSKLVYRGELLTLAVTDFRSMGYHKQAI